MKALAAEADERSAAGPADALAPGGHAARVLMVSDDEGAGQRLDNFLMRHWRNVPKTHVYRVIRSGEVRVNGSRCRPDDRLASGDRVRVPPLRSVGPDGSGAAAPAPVAVPLALPVLLEDDFLLVVDKPAGLAVHGGSGIAHGAIERLRAAHPQARFLELAHRLDRETSGVLVVCRKRRALVELHRQWRERHPAKRYLAIVRGRWPLRTRTLREPLERYLTAAGERRVAVNPEGREAISRVTGLRRFAIAGLGDFSLVAVDIETGRTHQIRVHLAHAGFPIAGDDKYGDFPLNRELVRRGLRRMYLHAARLVLAHPEDGRACTIEAPTPAAFQDFCDAGTAHERPGAPAVEPRA